MKEDQAASGHCLRSSPSVYPQLIFHTSSTLTYSALHRFHETEMNILCLPTEILCLILDGFIPRHWNGYRSDKKCLELRLVCSGYPQINASGQTMMYLFFFLRNIRHYSLPSSIPKTGCWTGFCAADKRGRVCLVSPAETTARGGKGL